MLASVDIGECGAHNISEKLESRVYDTFFGHKGKRVVDWTVEIGHDVKTKHVVLTLKACVGDAACGMFH